LRLEKLVQQDALHNSLAKDAVAAKLIPSATAAVVAVGTRMSILMMIVPVAAVITPRAMTVRLWTQRLPMDQWMSKRHRAVPPKT